MPLFNCPSRRPPTLYESPYYGPAYLMDYAGAQPCTSLSGVARDIKYDAIRDHGNYKRVGNSFWMSTVGGYPGPSPDDGVYDGVIVRSSLEAHVQPVGL